MILHSVVQDVRESPDESGFRRYEALARYATFVPEEHERATLFVGGGVIVVHIDTEGKFVGIAVADRPREHLIHRQGGDAS